MGWFDGKSGSSYRTDNNDNFLNRSDFDNAKSNGDLQSLSNGGAYDRNTGTTYWHDGTVRERK